MRKNVSGSERTLAWTMKYGFISSMCSPGQGPGGAFPTYWISFMTGGLIWWSAKIQSSPAVWPPSEPGFPTQPYR